ncbi:ENTH/VHS [Penicillium camemberti]|uniref:ENTH/VHS n=1 Tax=Penicillium camemberti (strain FM 013) TaxID=1429867 RepID=A0A0G4PTI5_PENC3|nr:ENTH/VHS [Penicillium camemberti]
MAINVDILKATFAACLLSPDPTSVPHDEISAFHTALERALSHCSQANIQTCKAWLVRFVAFSSGRVRGLVNYLNALAASSPPSQPTGSKISAKRQRLHILYLINDLLHHCKYHTDTPIAFSTVTGSLQLHIVQLVSHAANCDRQKNPRHHQRLDDLLDIWSEHDYFHPELVTKLRQVVIMGVPMDFNNATNDLNSAKKSGKNAPFIMPSTHGDPSTMWQDLPAGNIYPHLIPGSTSPIRAGAIKPIQLLAGPADPKLVEDLKSFLDDVDKIFDPEIPGDAKHTDVDRLGQEVIRGENTGDILDGEHYDGWSLEFCQPADTDIESSSDESRSSSVSRTTNKRQRYSDSSISQSESRSPSESRSYQPGFRHRNDARARNRSPQRSRTRESSYTPHEPSTSHFPPPHQPQQPPAPYNSFPTTRPSDGQYAHPPMGPNNGYPQVPAPNYGSWPPPPPYMPAMPFPAPGPGSSSAFPPPYHHHPSMSQGQRQGYGMSQGQHHFPPPYSGGRGGAPRGPPPQGGRGW